MFQVGTFGNGGENYNLDCKGEGKGREVEEKGEEGEKEGRRKRIGGSNPRTYIKGSFSKGFIVQAW